MDEGEMRAACQAGDSRKATELALRAYGPEIIGVLRAMHRDEDSAGDAFSMFAEKLFVTMPRFKWDCSMRTWAHRLARNASIDVRRASKPGRQTPLSDVSISALAARVRTETATYLRDETKNAILEIRNALPEDDRLLLMLRVERDLEWNDLARVFLEGEGEPDDETVKREAARLRKRFQLVKEKLREEGRARGLIKTE